MARIAALVKSTRDTKHQTNSKNQKEQATKALEDQAASSNSTKNGSGVADYIRPRERRG
jgi:Rod binding domain-containing protein